MRRHRRRHLPSKWIFVLLFILFGMGIGYAAISTTLTIDGTSDIDSARWSIYFDNVQVTSGSVTADLPAITDDTTVSFSANLENPGDFYEFTVDIINDGTLDAKLNEINVLPVLTSEETNYFRYTVLYLDGSEISPNDSLKANTQETLLIRVDYLVQSDTSLYPTVDTNFNFSVSMNYIQGHGTEKRIVYYFGQQNFTIGESLPTGISTYNSYQEVIDASGYPHFLKIILAGENDIIKNAEVGIVKNDQVYYLKGRGSTQNSSWYNLDSIYYESNKQVLEALFNTEDCSGEADHYFCSHSEGVSIGSYISKDGFAYYEVNTNQCMIDSNGEFKCWGYNF